MKNSIRWFVFVGALLFSLTGFAAAVIETATGQVRAGPNAKAATAASAGQRIQTGSVIVTGAKSLATLKFDDGQVAVVHENSEFRVAEYVFVKDQPAKDRFSFELLRGALRLVTATVAPRNGAHRRLHGISSRRSREIPGLPFVAPTLVGLLWVTLRRRAP